jgi:hypothetical protein
VDAQDLHPVGAHALAPGYEWADYRVLRLLASASVGLTYLAEDKNLGTPVVVHELLPIRIATRSASGTVVPLFKHQAGVLAEAVRRFDGGGAPDCCHPPSQHYSCSASLPRQRHGLHG